jgi:DNA ligase D-like protein (predicted ligase)
MLGFLFRCRVLRHSLRSSYLVTRKSAALCRGAYPDGFRAIGRKAGRSAQLWSRNQKDFTRHFPTVVRGVSELPNDTIIDGEIVALDEDGRPSFNLLQGFGNAQAIVLYVFDLLMLQGKDVRLWPLDDRRGQLRKIVSTLPDTIRYSETFNVPLSELVRAVRKHQLEGIVAKRASSQYHSWERSADWLKCRANRGQEFVIGGYIPNGNALDSILVGCYKGRDLMYAASVRAGIPPEFRRALFAHFGELHKPRCPFANLPESNEGRWGEGLNAAKMATCRWLDPFIVARIEFLEWTPQNRLRHPRFAGIRSDKDAREVLREVETTVWCPAPTRERKPHRAYGVPGSFECLIAELFHRAV